MQQCCAVRNPQELHRGTSARPEGLPGLLQALQVLAEGRLCHQVNHLLQPAERYKPAGLNIIRVHVVIDFAVILPLFQLLSKNRDLIAFLQHAVPLIDAMPEVHAHKKALPFSGFILCAAGFQVKFQHALLSCIPKYRVFGDFTVQHDAVLGLDDHASSPPNGSSALSSAEGASGAGIRVPAVLR